MIEWREELQDVEEISHIFQEFVKDYGGLNYESFFKASIAETPVSVDRRPRRRYCLLYTSRCV